MEIFNLLVSNGINIFTNDELNFPLNKNAVGSYLYNEIFESIFAMAFNQLSDTKLNPMIKILKFTIKYEVANQEFQHLQAYGCIPGIQQFISSILKNMSADNQQRIKYYIECVKLAFDLNNQSAIQNNKTVNPAILGSMHDIATYAIGTTDYELFLRV